MREISLNDYLSVENIWTGRLLGRDPFQQKRDAALVERTYTQAIWGEKLSAHRADPEELRRRLLAPDDGDVTVSFADMIVALPRAVYESMRLGHMTRTLQRFSQAPEVCELGCGYGPNLVKLNGWGGKRFYGGDYATTAVELGTLLKLDIQRFDYYRPESYDFIRRPSTVMTVHSIEQLPDAAPFLNALRALRDRIDVVIHFEPVYARERRSLLGQLRNRYAEINDYNRNLLDLLRDAADIEILHHDADAFGLNPLNPSSSLVWRFRE